MASRLLIPSALLLAAMLGACNAPDLASYDTHAKFGADVVEKTAVLFLDPAATGMLPLCFGEATKVCAYLLDAEKTYRVTAKLGEATDTGDADVKVTATAAVPAMDHRDWQQTPLPDSRGAEIEIVPIQAVPIQLVPWGKPHHF